MPKLKKDWPAEDAPGAGERIQGKLGHPCPHCTEEAARPLEPGETSYPMPRSTVLHQSKKAPGELECPNCGLTFPPVPPPKPEKPEKEKHEK